MILVAPDAGINTDDVITKPFIELPSTHICACDVKADAIEATQ